MLNESNVPLEEDGIEEEILVDEEVTITKAMWGDIGGNIENQTDLQNALDAKQDSLTEAQLNAVNSGITSEKVTTYDGYADQIASKADQSALNAEATTREQADTALGTRIDNEALARQQADNGLQTQIDAITSKSDVVDVVANYAALQAYDTSSLGNNDVIKVLDDETHEDALTYYRWSTTTQTWSYIGQEAPYYSKGQMDVKLAEKQDKLTAGDNITISGDTISATDTTYTAGNGLNLNGTEFSADTTVLATKTEVAPKLQTEVVAELPTTGEEGKLYLTPKAHTTQTATGNPITISLSEDAGRITSAQLDGDTYQQSYTGKNLFNYTAASFPVVDRGITATLNSDGSITVTGVPTASYIRIVELSMIDLLEDGATYTISSDNYSPDVYLDVVATRISDGSLSYPANTRAGSASFTVDKSTYSQYRVSINTYTTASWGSESKTITRKFQLEKSASATSWEKYVGGVPSPNPDYPQQIQTVTGEQTVEIVGKNLFDKDNMDTRNGYLYSTTFSYRTSNADRTFIVPCEPNTTYTISRSVITSSFRAAYIDLKPSEIPADVSSETRLTCAGYIANNSGTSITITTSATAKSLLVHYGNTNTDGVTLIDQSVATIMVEKSASATAYAPYNKQTLPISLGSIELCKLGDYQDYIYKSGSDWKVHKALKKITLDGSEAWYSTPGNAPFGLVIDDSLLTTSDDNPPLIYCDKFIKVAQNASWSQYPSLMSTNSKSNSTKTLRARYASMANLSDFQAWLGTHNTTLYYVLATATDTTITDQTLIAQLEAVRNATLQASNTITNTATGSNLAGDMEIGYYGFNPRNRYDKWLWLDINNEYEQIGS